MVSVAELTDRMRAALEGTPYTVTDERDDGFTVHIDVVDAQWWTLLHRRSLSKAFTHTVRVDPEGGTYTVTDQSVRVEWQAGADVGGGVPRPVLRASARVDRGTLREFSFRREYALDDQGEPGAVVDYAFDSREGNRLIDDVLIPTGLRKRMNGTARLGLLVALVTVAGLLVAGAVLAFLALVGVL